MATQATDDGSAWSTFRNRYFNVDGFVNQTTLGFEDGEATHYQLMDQAAVLRDYTVLLKGWQESGFSWVNRDDFIRYEYTTKFTHEVTTIEFADDQFPEPAPMQTPPRYLTISKSTVVETSKNYNLGFPFDNRQMATEAGQHEFGLFSARITQMFIELVSRLSLVKLFQRHPVDEMYHNPSEGITKIQLERLLEDEILTTFAGNHSAFGCLPAFLEAARKMERTNPGGGLPTHVLFNAEKQMLLKFGVESEARGTNLLDTDDFVRMYNMDFRPVPIFSTSTNKSDLDVGSLLSTRMEIGNHFHAKNLMLAFPADKVCIAQQGRISIFSENANGMQDVYFVDMNMADSRWTVDGRLNENHDGVKSMFTHYLGSSASPDEDDVENYGACRVIGDMEDKVLPLHLLKGMVDMMLKGQDAVQLERDVETVISNTNGNRATAEDVFRRLVKFASRAMTILGGTKNPLFRKSAAVADEDVDDVPGDSPEKYALRRIMRDVFKCKLKQQFPAAGGAYADGGRPDRTTAAGRRVNVAGYVGGGVAAPAIGGLSYGRQQDDNDMDVTGMYGRADPSTLERIDAALSELEHKIVAVEHDQAATVSRMRARVRAYMQAYSSDLDAEDMQVVANAVESLVEDVNEPARALFDAAGGRTANFTALLENIRSLEVFVTKLQRIGKGESFADAFGVAAAREAELDALVTLLAAPRAQNILNPARLVAFRFQDIASNAVRAGQDPDRPDIGAAPIDNVYSGITDFTDGSNRFKRRRTTHRQEDAGDLANLWTNVSRVQNMFYNNIERGVGYILLLTPIHRDVFDSMLRNDVFIPCEYILIRNQMCYESEGGCIVQAGSTGVGRAFLSYPAAEIGKSAMDMTGMMHVAQCVSIVIPDHKKRWMIPNLFYRRALGGANAKFYSRDSWAKHMAAGYYSKGYNRDSMVALSVPVGSHVADELHVSGFSHREDDESMPHYAEYRFYCKQLGYSRFDLDSICLHQRVTSQNANGMCFMGTYATYGMDGKRNQGFENQGHHKTERVGDKIIRQRGTAIRSTEGTQMFQF